jgi:hypothetical protein
MKKTFREIVLQIIPVMIGVYLGFVVSDWADARKRDGQARLFLESLRSEIASNRDVLEMVQEYHLMLRDSSQAYAAGKIKGKPRFFEGTRMMKLTSSAYQTGIQTGIINELPLGKIQAVNSLYTFQNEYNEFGTLMMASLIDKDFSDDPEDIRKIAQFLAVTMTDVVIKERDLLKGYGSLLEELEASP